MLNYLHSDGASAVLNGVGSVGSDFKRCKVQCNALSHLASGSLETPIGWHPILLRIIFLAGLVR